MPIAAPIRSKPSENRAQSGSDFEFASLRHMRENVAKEVDLATLPTCALHDGRNRRLEAFVRVADHEFRPGKAAFTKIP